MPHKPAPNRNVTVQFVSVSLTVELRSTLANWAADNRPKIVEWICDAAQAGYRVSVKEENQGYSASMSPVRENSINKSLVLVERAGSPDRALLRLLWAHNSHFKLVWPRDVPSPEDDW